MHILSNGKVLWFYSIRPIFWNVVGTWQECSKFTWAYILECGSNGGRNIPNPYVFWNVAGTWQECSKFTHILELGRSFPKPYMECGWNVARMFPKITQAQIRIFVSLLSLRVTYIVNSITINNCPPGMKPLLVCWKELCKEIIYLFGITSFWTKCVWTKG